MTPEKHTPGKWADIKGYITVRSGACIATVNSHNTAEGKANARLIAAAPLLLDALKEALDLSGDVHGWAERARDALSKATTD